LKQSILSVRQVGKSFEGLVALSDVSFEVPYGGVYGVIGPNGAGKTTLFNVVTGVYRPTDGSVHLEDKEITGLPVCAVARLGIARTFQTVRLFLDQTVLENVVIGTYRNTAAGMLAGIAKMPTAVQEQRKAKAEALECLRFVGMEDLCDRPAEALPFGQQRLLELARALASRPKLLLLDEPAAGLNDHETEKVGNLVKSLPGRGITVLLVEHNMDLMMSVADRIVVLNYGSKIMEGAADEVQADRRVVEAYLGEPVA
jgi:branched-chain amino acid transport system ATP-binding protein